MNYLKVLSLCLVLCSCINEDSLKPVIPEYLIHNNSSKTWLLYKTEQDGVVLKPVLKQNTTTYTFFHEHDFYIQQLLHLGSHKGSKGSFTLSFRVDGDKSLVLYHPDASIQEFTVLHIDEKEMHLQLTTGVLEKEKWFLKSYPKPF